MGKRDPPRGGDGAGCGRTDAPVLGHAEVDPDELHDRDDRDDRVRAGERLERQVLRGGGGGRAGSDGRSEGGGAPGEAPGAPFFSRSRAEASAAGTRLVVRVVGPGREERAARGAVGARVRGHGRNARLEEWARRVARNRRLSNHDRKNLPPRKWNPPPAPRKSSSRRVGLPPAGSRKTTAFTAPALAALAATPPCREDARGRAPRRRAWMTCVSFVLARRPLSHPRRVARDPPSVDERAVPRSRAHRLRP